MSRATAIALGFIATVVWLLSTLAMLQPAKLQTILALFSLC